MIHLPALNTNFPGVKCLTHIGREGDGNVRKRVLYRLLERLGSPKAGLHAFRHSRVTQLRKAGTPQDLPIACLVPSSPSAKPRPACQGSF